MTTLDQLRNLGFDLSRHIPFTRTYKPACSCCEVLVINGTPCHETGCPNQTHECRGCNNLIRGNRWQQYCEDCSY